LWELWRRLPADSFAVLTTPHRGAAEFDAEQPFTVMRSPEPVLLPYPWLARRIDRVADQMRADVVVLDPAVPLGHVGPSLRHPYGVVLHGAEVTVPGRLPVSSSVLARVLRGAELVVAAGSYPAAEGERAAGRRLPVVVVPPGVDVDRFRPLPPDEKARARVALGLPAEGPLVVSISRLVPRKGMDVLVRAAARLRHEHPGLVVAIAGNGRDRPRLERLIAETGAPVRLLGRVDDDVLPALYGCGDVFAMLCRTRWAGLEQEGFGIVFVEAAAAGVAQVAGASGGAAEAVAHGETGLVVDHPDDPAAVAQAIGGLLADPGRRAAMGAAARRRAQVEFSYDVLAARLATALAAWPMPSARAGAHATSPRGVA
jgi:phosphatidylinositol alpha-1,6-mannosyltransferase